jgi:hypothetical protein
MHNQLTATPGEPQPTLQQERRAACGVYGITLPESAEVTSLRRARDTGGQTKIMISIRFRKGKNR